MLYLASSSPRRRQLLEQIEIPYRQMAVAVDERPQRQECAEKYVVRLAIEKARAGQRQLIGQNLEGPVLGADTSVVVDQRILGKPRHREEGLAMLKLLSGRSHQVMSAVAIVSAERCVTRLSSSTVTFRALSEAERERYWQSGEPLGKAGGYAVQGVAATFISHLQGSYSGVMGLPLYETAQLIEELGLHIQDYE
ncbi:MAG: septum formation inhibitor Maf [Gammaproteobacteria bacterium]|nr:septum formation inhibitor Maf [Gammaproteobacteria bacterium]